MKHPTGHLLLLVLVMLVQLPWATAHDGPDPMCSWSFGQKALDEHLVRAIQGPDLKVLGQPKLEVIDKQRLLRMDGRQDQLVAASPWNEVVKQLPVQQFTIACWSAVDRTVSNGGLVGAFQDNGGFEKGWVLGYNEKNFYFALSTTGADDGDGLMTYLTGATSIEPGKLYHLVAVYDGKLMQLYVNGRLDAESTRQSGPILYPDEAQLSLGVYLDKDEHFPHHGRLGSVAIYDVAAKESWVQHDFQHQASWAELPAAKDPSLAFSFLVKPYLQYGTQDSMRVMCELSQPGDVRVEYGENSQLGMSVASQSDDKLLHATKLEKLEAETAYYYQVVVKLQDSPSELRSELLSFQTATTPQNPYAFVVMGDTQGNPQVNGKLAQMAWALRPNFLLLPGDLVDDGLQKHQWVHEFFESMNPLIARVPLYPVLGNHERNADHYYRYMNVPEPEYYYQFRYGNAVFFVLDSNKKVGEGSEQYVWLEAQLKAIQELETAGKSDILWKFVSFHHPVYSSDENDYGDLWKGKSTWGDMRLRPLTKLFDDYGVDIVWNGHIHSYERTWPMLKGETQTDGGTTYIVTGGGGGGLEQAGPIRPWFQNNVRRDHHFMFIAINGPVLEMKAFDLEGRLFDTIEVRKQRTAP